MRSLFISKLTCQNKCSQGVGIELDNEVMEAWEQLLFQTMGSWLLGSWWMGKWEKVEAGF